MPENPLLPNAKLRKMYALMQRARALTKTRAGAPRFEAILCSTLMHIEPGDFVATLSNAPAAATLAAEHTSQPSRKKTPATPPALPPTQRLATVTGIAQGLKLAGANRLAIYFANAGSSSARTEQGWQQALTHAHTARLPLLFLCADNTDVRVATNPNTLTWRSISKLAKSLKLPVLTVDGTDAAALYRVLQESTLRARTGGGATVLWCLLPKHPTAATDPIRHMNRYLADRNLLSRAPM